MTLLREKQCAATEEFIEICKLRQGAALHTIDSLLDLPGEEKWPVDQLLFRAIAHCQANHLITYSAASWMRIMV
uniref:Uncharacterized protein n=1 Tax=Daphnia galeata TaxID=27404 RepID=A0A8J2RXF7_9CRUS|nr:unnamed protein product [Daphnia galeata]